MLGRISRLSFFVCLSFAAPAFAQQEPAAESPVAAAVGDDKIEVAEVQRMLDQVFKGKTLPTGDLLPAAKALVLEEIVNRRLVLAYAHRLGEAPSNEDLAKAKKQLQIQLAAQGRKVADVLKAESMTMDDLQRQVVWGLVWGRFLTKYRTPERRETWFQNHHEDLDGTERAVSQILLRPAAGAGPKEDNDLMKQADAIRAEITSGKLDFAAAAEKYSAGPSAKQGGRLGKIGRHGPMDETFSRAAFQLKAGEIGPPFADQFGVHLIRCDEVVPGTKKLAELTGPIDDALAKELLQKISQLERQHTDVKYTPDWPHFTPGTRELAK